MPSHATTPSGRTSSGRGLATAATRSENPAAAPSSTNYFPVKEDLLFDRAPELVRWPADAVTSRAPGITPVHAVREAYRRLLLERWSALSIVGYEFGRLVEASPTLPARERQIFAEQEAAPAAALIAESGTADPDAAVRARVHAARLGGVVRVLHDEARRRVLDAGDVEDAVVAAMERISTTAFDDASDERAEGRGSGHDRR